MAEWPQVFHPFTTREVPTDLGGTTFVEDIDVDTAVPGYPLRPDTWQACAAWCDGKRVLDDTGSQAVAVNNSLADEDEARLGDYVMHVDRPERTYEVSRGPAHAGRWRLASDLT